MIGEKYRLTKQQELARFIRTFFFKKKTANFFWGEFFDLDLDGE
jgi:hypothetical protein